MHLFRRAAIALVVLNLIGMVATAYCFMSARRAGHHGDDTFVALADEVTRASQAQVAAERMVAVGRTYLLSAEPELLYRAQAADAKLSRTLALLEQGVLDQAGRRSMDDVEAAAHDYRGLFATLTSGLSMHEDPRLVATALRERVIPARERLLSALDQFVERRQAMLNAQRALAREAGRRWLLAFVVIGTAETGLSLVLVWFFWSALRSSRARADEGDRRPRRELDGRHSGSNGSRSGGRATFRRFA